MHGLNSNQRENAMAGYEREIESRMIKRREKLSGIFLWEITDCVLQYVGVVLQFHSETNTHALHE